MNKFEVNLIKDNKLIGSFGSNNWQMTVSAFYQRINAFPNATVELWINNKKIKNPKAYIEKWKNFSL